VPTGAYGTTLGDDRTRTRDDWSLASLEHYQAFGAHAVQTRLSFLRSHYRGDWLYAADDPDTGSYVFSDEGDGQRVEIDTRALFAPWRAFRFTAGLNGQRHFRAFQSAWIVGEDSNTLVQRSDRPFGQSAAYMQTEWQVTPSAMLLGGLRVEDQSHLNVTTNPRAGLVWHADARTTVKALAGRAFRAPNLYEMFYEDGESSKANPDLIPETVESYEASLEHRMARGLSMTVTGFRNDLRDWIGITADATDGLSVYRNHGSLAVYGGECELGGVGPRGVRWGLGYGYSRPDAFTDPPNFARHVAQGSLVQSLPWRRGRVAVLVRAIGERRNYAGDYIAPYAVTNLTLGFDPWSTIGVTLTMHNLFDENATDPAGAEHTLVEIPRDRRHLQARVRLLF
jgi:iron complex outermembrane receptor protein